MAESEIGSADKDDEEDDEDDDLTPESLLASEREGLTDIYHLFVFRLWYQTGGQEKGLDILSMDRMPGAMMKDLLYLSSKLYRKKNKLKRMKENQKEWRKRRKDNEDDYIGSSVSTK